jgi:hypothetical protein
VASGVKEFRYFCYAVSLTPACIGLFLLLSKPVPLNTYDGGQQFELLLTMIIVSVFLTLAGLITFAVLLSKGRKCTDFLFASFAAASPVIILLIIFTSQFR